MSAVLVFLGLLCLLLTFAGLVLLTFGLISLWIAAFRQSILWGLLVVFIPPLMVVFAFYHWRTARSPVLRLLSGAGLFMLGASLATALGVIPSK
jgi:hypothetical protein